MSETNPPQTVGAPIKKQVTVDPQHLLFAVRGVNTALDILSGGANDEDSVQTAIGELALAGRILSTQLVEMQ